MKEFVRWGFLLTLLAPPLLAQAQPPASIPWPNGRSVWERSAADLPGDEYLSYRQVTPQDPEPAAAPAAADASAVQPLPDPNQEAPQEPLPKTAPAPTTPLPQSALYDYSRVQGPGGCGTYASGPACQECVSGGHWGGWLPRCGAWLPHLFTAHHGGGCGGNMCAEEPCAGGACAGNACAGNACGGCPTCCPWFGGIYGLVLTRTDDARTTLSYDDVNWGDPLLRTSDADAGYLGGVEVRFGRCLNECYALQAGYWGLVPNEAEANVCNACSNVELTTPIRFDHLVYDNGIFADSVLRWFGMPGDPALRHRLRRSYEVQNVELNLIRNPFRRTGCVHYELLAGIRYLRLDDDFSFATDYTSDEFGDDPANEVDYNIEVDNNLLGFQVGGRMDYYVWGGLALNLGTAIGIYGNHMTQQQYIWGGNGFAYVDGTDDVYNVERSANDVAFLGDLFAGVSYDLTQRWRITCGYRAMAATGIALATSQIPRDSEFGNMVYSPTLDSNDSLVLHGGYAGLEFNW